MNAPLTKYELQVARALNAVLWLWAESEFTGPDDSSRWLERQAYRNAMNAARNCGVIEDFDLVKQAVKIRGQWTNARQVLIV